MNYYNEYDPKAAAWLRELIAAGLIPAGDVDERSITEIKPHELTGYTQCHFFAGIAGWSLALQLAGWPVDRHVWTGSCPCQPFSAAGQGKGASDDRHLWPVFASLIAACRPERVFGEQVAQAVGFGWLDGVCADLGAQGYTVGAAVLGAHSVGAPHIRQRLYWVADLQRARLEGLAGDGNEGDQSGRLGAEPIGHAAACSAAMRWANAFGWKRVSFAADCLRSGEWDGTDEPGDICSICGLDYCEECDCPGPTQSDEYEYHERDGILFARPHDHVERLADSAGGQREQRLRPQGNIIQRPSDDGATSGLGDTASGGCGIVRDAAQQGRSGHALGAGWSRFEIVNCRDGKARRFPANPDGIEPVLQRVVDGFPGSLDNRRAILDAVLGFPLAEGIRGRVPLLRGYGNAIVPQTAAEFIQAFNDINLA